MNFDKPVKAIAKAHSIYFLEVMEPYWQRSQSICKSPIEALFLVAVHAYWIGKYMQVPKVNGFIGTGPIEVTTQKQIGPYRVDFFIHCSDYDIDLVVECDGHEFHERTKEQAAKDRSRDRELQSKGYVVLRFTGSEIYADPWKCAQEVEEQIFSASHRRNRA